MKIPAHNESRIWVLVKAIQNLAEGRNNATGSFTATLNAATTTVQNSVVTENDVVLLMPTTAAANADTTTFISSVSKGSFVVTHGNNSTAGRTFRYVVLGG